MPQSTRNHPNHTLRASTTASPQTVTLNPRRPNLISVGRRSRVDFHRGTTAPRAPAFPRARAPAGKKQRFSNGPTFTVFAATPPRSALKPAAPLSDPHLTHREPSPARGRRPCRGSLRTGVAASARVGKPPPFPPIRPAKVTGFSHLPRRASTFASGGVPQPRNYAFFYRGR